MSWRCSSALHTPSFDTNRPSVSIDGNELNPRFHLSVHEIVATQLADDDPPEVWATAQRLRQLAYGGHEILHMLGRGDRPAAVGGDA